MQLTSKLVEMPSSKLIDNWSIHPPPYGTMANVLRQSELCSSGELGLQNSQSTFELLELIYNRAFGLKFSKTNKF
jgi:hypothetical protein